MAGVSTVLLCPLLDTLQHYRYKHHTPGNTLITDHWSGWRSITLLLCKLNIRPAADQTSVQLQLMSTWRNMNEGFRNKNNKYSFLLFKTNSSVRHYCETKGPFEKRRRPTNYKKKRNKEKHLHKNLQFKSWDNWIKTFSVFEFITTSFVQKRFFINEIDEMRIFVEFFSVVFGKTGKNPPEFVNLCQTFSLFLIQVLLNIVNDKS